MTERLAVALAAVNGFIAVAAGAFGAHALKRRLPEDLLVIFDTAARYHMTHALALFATAWLIGRGVAPARLAAWLMLAGILLFSGSLYALALSGIRTFGAVTPIGGVCFLAGWGILVYAALTKL
jgi:uncharacterized membrane protein YgdD (TMEM256/DUF423 family)